MAKAKEELDQLKNECEALNNKLKGLTEDELKEVCGGAFPAVMPIIYGSSGNVGWPAYYSCKYRKYVMSTDPNLAGYICYAEGSKGTFPACAECPENK